MKKLLCATVLSILGIQTCFANADLLEQQLRNLKSMGIDTSQIEGTFRAMQEDFRTEERESGKSSISVQPSYFSQVNRSSLESCNTGEVQLDTICQAAMLRHQSYLTAVAQNKSQQDIDALYEQHKMAAKHYIAVHDELSR